MSTPGVKNTTSSGGLPNVGPALPSKGGEKTGTTSVKDTPKASALPDSAELKKITQEVKSLGVDLSDLLDSQGDLSPEKLAEVKKRLVAAADLVKDKDIGAAARLYSRAAHLDPRDSQLQLKAVRPLHLWSQAQTNPQVKETIYREILVHLDRVGIPAGLDTEFSKYQSEVHLFLGERLLKSGQKRHTALKHLDEAVRHGDGEVVSTVVSLLKTHRVPDFYSRVGEVLSSEGRHQEALTIYQQGARETKNKDLKSKYIKQAHLAFEQLNPYDTEFDTEASPLTFALDKALRKQGFISAQLKGVMESADEFPHEEERVVTSGDIYSFIQNNLQDPKVKAALLESGIDLSKALGDQIKEQGFVKALAHQFLEDKNYGGIIELSLNGSDTIQEDPELEAIFQKAYEIYLPQEFDKALGELKAAWNSPSPEKARTLRRIQYLQKMMKDYPAQNPSTKFEYLASEHRYLRFVRQYESSWGRQESLEGLNKEIERVEGGLREIRQSLRNKVSYSTPAGEISQKNLDQVQLAIKISTELGEDKEHFEDLKLYAHLLNHGGKKFLDKNVWVDQMGALLVDVYRFNEHVKSKGPQQQNDSLQSQDVLRELEDVVNNIGRTNIFDITGSNEGHMACINLISQFYELAANPSSQSVMAEKLIPFLSSSGMKKYAEAEVKVAMAYNDVAEMSDVTQMRPALLQVLAGATEIYDDEKQRIIIADLAKMVDPKEGELGALKLYTQIASIINGTTFEAITDTKNLGDPLANKLLEAPGNDPDTVQGKLQALAYFQAMGNERMVDIAKGKIGDSRKGLKEKLSGKDISDSKERIRFATMVVQIDQAFVEGDVECALKGLQAHLADKEGKVKKPDLSRLLDSLETLRNEIDQAKDLPLADRIEGLQLLSTSLGAYQALTKGDHALIEDSDYQTTQGQVQKLASKLFGEKLDALIKENKLLPENRDRVLEDFGQAFSQACKKGNVQFLSQITLESLGEFAEISEGAHLLLQKAGGLKGPAALDARVKAASMFSALGLEGRVEAIIQPLLADTQKIPEPGKRVVFLFKLVQMFQENSLTQGANRVLDEIIAQDTKDAAPGIKDCAQLARGMKLLNQGKLAEAETCLAKIPHHPTAQMLLANIQKLQTQQIYGQRLQVVEAVFRQLLFDDSGEVDVQKIKQVENELHLAMGKIRNLLATGKAENLDQAIRQVPALSKIYHHPIASTYLKEFIRNTEGKSVTSQIVSQQALHLLKTYMLPELKEYSAAAALAQSLLKDPHVGKDAKWYVEDRIPEAQTFEVIGRGITVLALAYARPAVAGTMMFGMLTTAGSDEEFVDRLYMGVEVLGPFMVARRLAVGARAIVAARATSKGATLLARPLVARGATWLAGTTAEAAGFTASGAMLQAAFTGNTAVLDPKHLLKEFGSMFVTFGLLHMAGKPLQMLAQKSGKNLATAESAFAKATEEGIHVAKARDAYRRALLAQKGAQGVGWAGRVLSFTGSEYFNEWIGLREGQEGMTFTHRLINSAIMDAQMVRAGQLVNSLYGGKYLKMEQATEMKLQVLTVKPLLKGRGVDPESPQGEFLVQLASALTLQGEKPATVVEQLASVHKVVDKLVSALPEFPAEKVAKLKRDCLEGILVKGWGEKEVLDEVGKLFVTEGDPVEQTARPAGQRHAIVPPPPSEGVPSVNVPKGDKPMDPQKAIFNQLGARFALWFDPIDNKRIEIKQDTLWEYFDKVLELMNREERYDPTLQDAIDGIKLDREKIGKGELNFQESEATIQRLRRVAIIFDQYGKALEQGMDTGSIQATLILGEYYTPGQKADLGTLPPTGRPTAPPAGTRRPPALNIPPAPRLPHLDQPLPMAADKKKANSPDAVKGQRATNPDLSSLPRVISALLFGGGVATFSPDVFASVKVQTEAMISSQAPQLMAMLTSPTAMMLGAATAMLGMAWFKGRSSRSHPVVHPDPQGNRYQISHKSIQDNLGGKLGEFGLPIGIKTSPKTLGDAPVYEVTFQTSQDITMSNPRQVTLEMTAESVKELGISVLANGQIIYPQGYYDIYAEPVGQQAARVSPQRVAPQVVPQGVPQVPVQPVTPDPAKIFSDTSGRDYHLSEWNPRHAFLVTGDTVYGQAVEIKRVAGKNYSYEVIFEDVFKGKDNVKLIMDWRRVQGLGIARSEGGRLVLKEGVFVQLNPTEPVSKKSPGKTSIPLSTEGPPEEVHAIMQRNQPGVPRKGEVSLEATNNYGSVSFQTHEGVGYKDANQDGAVQAKFRITLNDGTKMDLNVSTVLDGMGGVGRDGNAGGIASREAGTKIARYLQAHWDPKNPEQVMKDAFHHAHEHIQKITDGGTTAVCHVVVQEGGESVAYIAHVGDAKAYVLGRKADGSLGIRWESQDQSLVQQLADAKHIPNDELSIRAHDMAHIVTGGLGGSSKPDPQVKRIPLKEGDVIVMGSDGLSENLTRAEIEVLLSRSQNAQDAQRILFNQVIEKMMDRADAKSHLSADKRLAIVRPDGSTGYMDAEATVWDAPTGGKMIDYYKKDNLTVHVYEHIPGKTSKTPANDGAPSSSDSALLPPLGESKKFQVANEPFELRNHKGLYFVKWLNSGNGNRPLVDGYPIASDFDKLSPGIHILKVGNVDYPIKIPE